MYIFLPIIIFSIAGIAVIFIRKMPNVSQMPIYDASAFYDSWLYKFPDKIKNFRFGHIREISLSFVEKNLRKFKIILLRFENALSRLTAKLKKKHGNGKTAPVVEKLSAQSGGNTRLIEDLSKIFNSIEDDAPSGKNKPENSGKETGGELDDDLFVEREKDILEEIRINPRSAESYRKLGFLYFEYDHSDYALSSFQQAIKLGCKDGEIEEAIKEISGNL